MWRPSGGVLPSAAPLPAAPPLDAPPPPRPRPPDIPAAFLQPMPRRFKRGGGSSGPEPGQLEDIDEMQVASIPPFTPSRAQRNQISAARCVRTEGVLVMTPPQATSGMAASSSQCTRSLFPGHPIRSPVWLTHAPAVTHMST